MNAIAASNGVVLVRLLCRLENFDGGVSLFFIGSHFQEVLEFLSGIDNPVTQSRDHLLGFLQGLTLEVGSVDFLIFNMTMLSGDRVKDVPLVSIETLCFHLHRRRQTPSPTLLCEPPVVPVPCSRIAPP